MMCGCGLSRKRDRGRADVQREHKAVSKAVGVEQLGRREGDIIGPKPEHAARVVLTADGPIAVQMHGRFGSARYLPQHPQPERHVVSCRRHRVQVIRAVMQPLLPGKSPHRRRIQSPGARSPARAAPVHFSPHRTMNDRHTGAALGERVGVVGRTQAGARRHGDGTNLDRAEIRGCELRARQAGCRRTRSSSWRPARRRPWPTRLVNSARSRYLTWRSPHLIATLSPRPSARCRSTNAVARLSGRWCNPLKRVDRLT